MATKDQVRTRVPRGTKTVTQAFFEVLDAIPDAQQKAVATAALAGIRVELKARRLKAKEAAARGKAKTPAKRGSTTRGTRKVKTPPPSPAPGRKKAPARKTAFGSAGTKKVRRTAARSPRNDMP